MLDVADTQYLSIPDLLKATPSEEGGRRFIYLEASNEALDQQGEVVLAKALAESAGYYLRYGNLDLDHLTQLGPKAGIPDYPLYEIGRPADVRIDGPRTFVKGEIYQGAGAVAEKANQFWESLTAVKPPQRWYPSVGGSVLEKAQDLGRTVIRKVRWTNIGFSKTPVNQTVPTVATIPFGPLAKCWGVAGLDLTKALEAGYGTDAATLTGGAALRGQSLDRQVHSYWDFRDRLAGDVLKARVHPTSERLIDHATTHYGLDRAEAAEWTERFLADLKSGLNKRTE
ncbi:hypothetical protein [Azospirillum sp.]|uniref:hypothetical protein n=1 Tax=Azospirillum sp. TaxID=34012 RepID=UPI003D73387E